MVSKNFGSILQDTFKQYQSKVEIPKQYLLGLQSAQIFDQQLEFLLSSFIRKMQYAAKAVNIAYRPTNNSDLRSGTIGRIKTFLPQSENIDFYSKITAANKARNRFIHDCFKLESGFVNLDIDNFHLNEHSMKILKNWNDAYFIANKEIIKISKKYFRGSLISFKPIS